MSFRWYDAIVRHREPLSPIPTDVTPKLKKLADIKAVIFDVYGTLVVSGSGDVGSVDDSDRGDQIAAAIHAAEILVDGGRMPTIDDLHAEIRRSNESRRSRDCPKPEVEIVEVWRSTLARCGITPQNEQTWTIRCNRLAAEYEARANPTWPMPGASSTLKRLGNNGSRLGIVSNAQNFTLALVSDLIANSLASDGELAASALALENFSGVDSGFDPNLCVFSNRYRQAKPGPRLFNVLCDGLQRAGIRPEQAIYVGNDRLNDIWAASAAGLRTAWFAGDQRSLRARENDPRVNGLDQDLVVTELDQLLECL